MPKVVIADVVRLLSVVGLLTAAGCLPIPNRVVDAVAVAGVVRRGQRAVAGVSISVEQPSYVGPGDPGPCSGASPVVTDNNGVFRSDERKRWRGWLPLLGESADWSIPIRICIRDGAAWRPVFATHANGWDGELRVICDLEKAPREDDRSGDRGSCVLERKVGFRAVAPCGSIGVPKDREDCVRASLDSAYAQLSRATGRVLELIPDSARRSFLAVSSQWEDSLRAACRRRAAGPLDITPAAPMYADCVAAAARPRTASLAKTFSFQRSDAAEHGGCRGYEPDTITITGTLERRTYPGRPNYESIARGDEAETGFYLVATPSVCVTRNLDEVNQPTAGVSLIQLVLDPPGYERLRPYLKKRVTIRGTLFHSYTGHHHAELLLQVLK